MDDKKEFEGEKLEERYDTATNLFTDIIEAEKTFDLTDGTRIFPSLAMQKDEIYSCMAIKYILDEIGKESSTEIYITDENRNRMPEEIREQCNPEMTKNKFLSLLVGTNVVEFAESGKSRKTFVLFNVYSDEKRGLSTKSTGCGIKNYSHKSSGSIAEVVTVQLMNYCSTHKKYKPSNRILYLLYSAILYTTKGMRRNVKQRTLECLGWLYDRGADYEKAMEDYNTYEETVLACENIIYENAEIDDKDPTLAYAIITPDMERSNPEESPAFYDISSYKKALEHFRDLEGIDVWVLVLDRSSPMKQAVFQSRETCPIDMKHFAKKKNGDGNRHESEAKIVDFDLPRLIPEMREYMKNQRYKAAGKFVDGRKNKKKKKQIAEETPAA